MIFLTMRAFAFFTVFFICQCQTPIFFRQVKIQNNHITYSLFFVTWIPYTARFRTLFWHELLTLLCTSFLLCVDFRDVHICISHQTVLDSCHFTLVLKPVIFLKTFIITYFNNILKDFLFVPLPRRFSMD